MKTTRLAFALFASMLAFAGAGCVSESRPVTIVANGRTTFALALTVQGQPPTPSQWEFVRAKFAAMMAGRNWVLVDDPALAQQIIRVDLVPDPMDPEHKGETFVLGITPNPDTGNPGYGAVAVAPVYPYDDAYSSVGWFDYYWNQPYWYLDFGYLGFLPPYRHFAGGGRSRDHFADDDRRRDHKPGDHQPGDHKPGDRKPGNQDRDDRHGWRPPGSPPPGYVGNEAQRPPHRDNDGRRSPAQPHNAHPPGSSNIADNAPSRSAPGFGYRHGSNSSPAAAPMRAAPSNSTGPSRSYSSPASHSYSPPPTRSSSPPPPSHYSSPAPSYSPPPSSGSSGGSNSGGSSGSSDHFSGGGGHRPHEN